MRWARLRTSVRCGFGCELHRGQWAWVGQWRRGTRLIVCDSCGELRYRLTRPPVPVERDGKAEALGADR